jgi:hypothetical protein
MIRTCSVCVWGDWKTSFNFRVRFVILVLDIGTYFVRVEVSEGELRDGLRCTYRG